MTKAELIAKIAEETAVIKSFTLVVTAELANKVNVALVGFGEFKTTQRIAREVKNPATGEKLQIAAKTAPAFKPGKALKDAVNQ